MKKLVILFTMLFATIVLAGVVGRDISGGTSSYKGIFSEVVCEKGVACSKTGEKLKIQANPVKTITTLTSGDTTPSVANNTYFKTYLNNTVTITAFDDGVAGQEIIVQSQGAVTFDVTSTTIKCGTTDLVTASSDVTRFVYDGTDWRCTARVKASGNLN